jgi:hypothetical protein
MSPTREDLIRFLTKEPQAGMFALIDQYRATPDEILKTLNAHSDFERCAPRPEDGGEFAWRMSAMAIDPVVRATAFKHLRAIEQPPQRRERQRAQNDGAQRASLPVANSTANALVMWLMANPGEWLITQIAEARGCTIATIRDHIKRSRDTIATRRQNGHDNGPVLVSLKSA